MSELGSLGAEITNVERIAIDNQTDAFGDIDAALFQRGYLARIVGHQAQALDAEVLQHWQTNRVAAQIRRESQLLIGFNRIGAAILQMIGAHLVEQTDATAFLAQIKQDAAFSLAIFFSAASS